MNSNPRQSQTDLKQSFALNHLIGAQGSGVGSSSRHSRLHRFKAKPVELEQPAQPNFLIVEDDVTNALFIELVIEVAGRCAIAYDVADALKQLSDQTFDMILTDMNLVGNTLDGYAVLDYARNTKANHLTPIAAVTAQNVTRSQFISAGFDDVLFKPFAAEELLEMIGRFVKLPEELRNSFNR